MPFNLPLGIDWADGTTEIPINPIGASGDAAKVGTPIPLGQSQIWSNAGHVPTVEAMDGFPELERAEQATSSSGSRMSIGAAWSFLQQLGRGTFVGDSAGNKFRILSAKVRRLGKAAPFMAELTTVAESINFDTPPDEFSVTETEMGVNIIKNPRYFSNLYPTSDSRVVGDYFFDDDFTTMVGSPDNEATVAQVKMAIIRCIQTYQESPFYPSPNTINGKVQNDIIQSMLGLTVPTSVNGLSVGVDISQGDGSQCCLLAAAAAGEIIQNLWFQADTPYVPALEVKWVQYSFSSPILNPGCYIEDPLTVIPEYFTNPFWTGNYVPNTGNPGTENPIPPNYLQNIFMDFVKKNPQYFSTDGTINGNLTFSSLRKVDTVQYQRTWFRWEHSWIVAPFGHWNEYIFSNKPRPTTVDEYQPLQ